jgi:hypothetical protein
MSRSCAYCDHPGRITKEHLWPASLHRRLQAANGTQDSLFWLRRTNAEFAGEPTVKDVCQDCNNGVLSSLDSYICELFDRYFVRILQRGEAVRLEFDHHRLKRWMLKMCFNAARIHNAKDAFTYTPLLPYIRGEHDSLGRSVQLFAQLAYPGPIPADNRTDPELADAPQMWEPTDHRVGHVLFRVGQNQKLLRAVHLRSYSFLLAFSDPAQGRATAIDFERVFLSTVPGVRPLPASRSAVDLVCDGTDAWSSFQASRTLTLT